MSLFKRGDVWWYKFKFAGMTIRESSGLANKTLAGDVERKRHLELREGTAGIVRPAAAPFFSAAADDWLKAKKAEWAEKTYVNATGDVEHLKPTFGKSLLNDITPMDVAAYRSRRLAKKASPKTISNELGTLRGILLYHDFDSTWRSIRRKVKLQKGQNIGRAISVAEEISLLAECNASRSRSLYVAVKLALQTAMRSSELRLLQWRQIDFTRKVITVGKSKTLAGTGREIPMLNGAFQTLSMWAENFPQRKLNHFVFPAEQYGGRGEDDKFGFSGGCAYDTDPTQPIGSWKEAWEAAKARAGVTCRFHDLRHTCCTRLLEAGVSHAIVAEIMGWSSSTAIRMIKEVYGHIGLPAKRTALALMEAQQDAAVKAWESEKAEAEAALVKSSLEGAQKGAQSQRAEFRSVN